MQTIGILVLSIPISHIIVLILRASSKNNYTVIDQSDCRDSSNHLINDCISSNDNVSIVKCADDTAIIGMIHGNDERQYREELFMFENWCEENFLVLNIAKTKGMTFDFRSNKGEAIPIMLKGRDIQSVKSFKYLGTILDNELSWKDQCQSLYARGLNNECTLYENWIRSMLIEPWTYHGWTFDVILSVIQWESPPSDYVHPKENIQLFLTITTA